MLLGFMTVAIFSTSPSAALVCRHLPVGFKNIPDQRVLYRQQLRELILQLCRVHLVVAPRCNSDLSLLLESEVCPLES
jgi:hypothetical protein